MVDTSLNESTSCLRNSKVKSPKKKCHLNKIFGKTKKLFERPRQLMSQNKGQRVKNSKFNKTVRKKLKQAIRKRKMMFGPNAIPKLGNNEKMNNRNKILYLIDIFILERIVKSPGGL